MRPSSSTPLLIAALVVAQNLSWGPTQGLPAIAGADIAATFGVLLPAVMAGPTVMLVVMGLAAVPLGRLFERLGARPLMTLGSTGIALGLAAVAAAPTIWAYYAAWLLIGLAGAASLSTAAQIAITELAGVNARRPIATMLIFGGLSTTLYWPMLNWLDGHFGWRVAALVAAALVAFICAPIHWFMLPRQHHATARKARVAAPPIPPLDMLLLALSIGLNGFVTGGFALTIVTLFEARAIDHTAAVGIASLLGITQIAARATDFIGGRGWNPVTTGLVTSAVLPASLLLLLTTHGTPAAIGFIILYGLASGALAVARATMPLQLFAPESYARASSMLAFPINLAFALGPPFFAALLVSWGSNVPVLAALIITMLGCGALIALVVHRRRRMPA